MWGGVGIVGGNSAISNGAFREIDLSHLLLTFSVIWFGRTLLCMGANMYKPIIRTKNGSGGKLNIPILARLRKMKIGFFLFEDEKISGYQLAFFKGHDFIAKKKKRP